MNEEVQPATSVESNATFGDYVKGANNPKVEELKEIIDYLPDPEVDFPSIILILNKSFYCFE
jgi:hypothetical protein